MLFNTEKYKLLYYSTNKEVIRGLWHNNIFIERSSFASHLGNIVGPETDMLYDKIIDKFITYFNSIEVIFGKAHVTVKYKLFQSYCMDLYGSLF